MEIKGWVDEAAAFVDDVPLEERRAQLEQAKLDRARAYADISREEPENEAPPGSMAAAAATELDALKARLVEKQREASGLPNNRQGRRAAERIVAKNIAKHRRARLSMGRTR